jgi:hypothetical protein
MEYVADSDRGFLENTALNRRFSREPSSLVRLAQGEQPESEKKSGTGKTAPDGKDLSNVTGRPLIDPPMKEQLLFTPDPNADVDKQKNGARAEYIADFAAACTAWFATDEAWHFMGKNGTGLAVKLIAAAAVGAISKFGMKYTLEHGFVPEANRTSSPKDLAWGVFDGFAGVTTSRLVTPAVRGMFYKETAMMEEPALDAAPPISFARELAAESLSRAAGYAIWRAPYSVHDHADELIQGRAFGTVSGEIALTAAFGFGFGATRATVPMVLPFLKRSILP